MTMTATHMTVALDTTPPFTNSITVISRNLKLTAETVQMRRLYKAYEAEGKSGQYYTHPGVARMILKPRAR